MPTWGPKYWPAFLVVAGLALLVPEVYALCTNVHNTLSWWVWQTLKVQTGVWPWQWTAGQLLTFGVWSLVVFWLTFHFWLRWFT